jgi:hypothetical protein
MLFIRLYSSITFILAGSQDQRAHPEQDGPVQVVLPTSITPSSTNDIQVPALIGGLFFLSVVSHYLKLFTFLNQIFW